MVDPLADDIFNTGAEEGVIVEFTGVSPDASVQIRNLLDSSDIRSQVSYKADVTSGLAIGDTVKITATLPSSAVSQGYELSREETEVTVGNVAYYISSTDDLTDEMWAQIEAEYDDWFYALRGIL